MRKKKIIILTTDTPHHRFFINYLINFKSKDIKIEKIFFEKKKKNNLKLFKKYILKKNKSFFNKLFLNPYLRTGIHEKLQLKFEKNKFNKKCNLILNEDLISVVSDINSNQVLDFLKKKKYDRMFVYGTSKIEEKIFKTPKYGAINAHGGFLPEYRGLDTNLWALFNGEYSKVYSTIHKVEKNFDTGEVLMEKRLPNDKLGFIKMRYFVTLDICEMTVDAMNNCISNKYIKKENNCFSKYYYPMPILIKIWIFLKLLFIKTND